MDDQTRDILLSLARDASKSCDQIRQDLNQDEPPKDQIARFTAELSSTATLMQLLIQRVA